MSKTKNITNHILMFGLLALSGSPYFTSRESYYIIFFCFSFIVYFQKKGNSITKNFKRIFLFALFLIFMQVIIFSFFRFYTIAGFIIRTLIAFFVVSVLKERFVYYFLKQIKWLAILSFIVYLPILLYPNLMTEIQDRLPSFFSYQHGIAGHIFTKKSLILVNLNMDRPSGITRNCGPFWEPGTFGGFLIVALILNVISSGHLFRKTNVIFLLAIFSTFSTTAYIATFTLIVFFYIAEKKIFYKTIAVFLFLPFFYYVFISLDFLSDKITTEYDNNQQTMKTQKGNSRMASAVLDLKEFIEYPLTGKGLWPETRFNEIKGNYAPRNNGLTNFLTIWGLPFFILFYYYFWQFLKQFIIYKAKIQTKYALYFLIVIFVITFSENYNNLIFFWAFPFLEYYDRKKNKIRYNALHNNTNIIETNLNVID